jgi:hypothetical protein
MTTRDLLLPLLVILICSRVNARGTGRSNDTLTAAKSPSRVYTTVRLPGTKPTIDGNLNDACWDTGEWAGNFVQWIPREGAEPSQPTYVKLLYDDRNIYVAIRAVDREPDKVLRLGGRRDQFRGDMVGITFDSYHDHRTGFEFDVTAAGQKIDLLLTNPSNPDMNWSAVWYAEVGTEDSAWTAEFEIPFSQLRYGSDHEQVWGMHCWRWIDRNQEESDWEPQTSTGPGILYLFGELRGLKGLPSSRRIEVMPFALGKVTELPAEAGNPFADGGRTWRGNAGLDLKMGITSNFTADVTVNPDFGQVETDPSVMNLSAFETFYEEKRPFFLEGKNIFNFDFDNVNMFYSRRIGHAPTFNPEAGAGEFVKNRDNTTILGALKVSGKTSGGLAVGVLQSITNKEYAQVGNAVSQRDVPVEPLTSTTLARVQQDYDEGSTMLGGIVTATNRRIDDAHLDFLNHNAYTGGIDLIHQWNDKEFFVSAKMVGSTISGSKDAIALLQRSSARYYQRPDIDYVIFDTSRTSLSGYGGQIRIGKGSKGLWRYSTQLDWRSPGLDLNDLGYMQTADVIKSTSSLSYFVNQPVGILRTYSLGVSETSNLDFGFRYLSTNVGGELYLEFLNNWSLKTDVGYASEALDPRLLRGGPAMLVPASWEFGTRLRTDPSSSVVFECDFEVTGSSKNESHGIKAEPSIAVIPVSTLRLALGVSIESAVDDLQYIGTYTSGTGAPQFMLGRIDRQSASATIRVDWNLTNDVSLQFYGSPFGAAGRYSQFKSVTNPRAESYTDRFVSSVDENRDFVFGQFRSIMVFRWEYLPGSQLYLVWSHERTRYDQPATKSVGSSIRELGDVAGVNVFLMKLSYWFTI